MLLVNLDVSQIEAAERVVERELETSMHRALGKAAALVAAEARERHDYKDHSVRGLTNSIRDGLVTGTMAGRDMHVDVTAHAKYSKIIEDGSRAHEIRAKKKKALRFTFLHLPVFARRVQHPGTKPYRFLANALERSLPEITELSAEATAQAFAAAGFEIQRGL